MKIKLFFFSALFAVLASCGKEEALTANPDFNPAVKVNAGGNNQAIGPQIFKADIDGVSINTTSIKGGISGTMFYVSGFFNDDSLRVVATNFAVGTYLGADDGVNSVIFTEAGEPFSSTFEPSLDAEITVSSYDATRGLISGRFKATIKALANPNTKSVMNGEFKNIRVPVQAAVNLGTMTAMVDGQLFESYACVAINQAGQTLISATNAGATKSITVQLTSTPRVGNMIIDDFNYFNYASDINGGLDPEKFFISTIPGPNFTPGNGTLNFSKVNYSQKELEGTFSFKAYNSGLTQDSVIVTNGSFSAAIQ